MRGKKHIWLMAGAAVLLTAIMGGGVILRQAAFFKHYPHFFDDVSYSHRDAVLARRVQAEGRLSVALDEWRQNARDPLRTVPLVLFCPSLLQKKLGHLATALPLLGLFLFMLSWTVWQRTRSLPYALTASILFSLLPGLYDFYTGLGSHWLDLPAALPAACAALVLVTPSNKKRLAGWIVFAVFAAIAALCRYVAAMFVLISCAPPLLLTLGRGWRQEKRSWKGVGVPLLLITVVIGTMAGPFLVKHFDANRSFYQNYGYALKQPWLQSARGVQASLGRFLFDLDGLGVVVVALLAGLLALHLWAGLRRHQWQDLAVSFWLAASVPLFMVFVLKTTATHPVAYAVPLVFFFLVNAVPWTARRASGRWQPVMVVFVFLLALFRLWETHRYYMKEARHPPLVLAEEKKMTIALAGRLARFGDGLPWAAFFDEYAIIVDMECHYRFGILPRSAPQRLFNAHESAWRADYPQRSADEIAGLVLGEANRMVKVAVVFHDPAQALETPFLHNPVSRRVAQLLAEEIPRSWKKAFTLPTQKYGVLDGYLNPAFSE